MRTDISQRNLDLMTARRVTVETLISRYMLHWGIDRHDVGITWDRNGSPVPIISSGGAAGSMHSVTFGSDGLPDSTGREAIAGACFQAIRRILRSRSLKSAGFGEEDAPSWSISGDPAVLSCLRHYGVDLSSVPRDARDLLARIGRTGLTVDNGDVVDGLVRIGVLADQSGRWSISDYDRLRLNVHVPVPDTVFAALGRDRMTLERIVLLPFDVPERLTRRVRRGSDDGLAIQLDRRLGTWTPVPAGVDRAWLRVPLCQVQDIPF